MLVDFDGRQDRLNAMMDDVPLDLTDRVFVLGVFDEPEVLRSALHLNLEQIGTELADECLDSRTRTWAHPLLAHNAAELERLRQVVWPFLVN